MHIALDLKAAEVEAVKDSFQEINDFFEHAHLSSCSSWINSQNIGNVSFFSLSCGLSSGVTQIMNLKAKKFDIFIFTCKHMDRKRKSSLK